MSTAASHGRLPLIEMDDRGLVSLAKLIPRERRGGKFFAREDGDRIILERAQVVASSQVAPPEVLDWIMRSFDGKADNINAARAVTDEEVAELPIHR
ncbi:hypothetical protein ACX31A_15405 [Dermacoccus nishinomiyaensis]